MEKGEMGENATGRLATYYVAECMEFNRYGEYREDIQSAEEAVKYYQSIPSERLNAGKGIGLHVEEEDGIPLDFPLCLLYTSPSPRDRQKSRMPSSA